jgi:(p)ppGpp synthase/HD superfamily hydrolase
MHEAAISPLLRTCVILGMDMHHDHMRKRGQVLYVSHLFSVAALVLEMGGTQVEAAAAMLHDTVEDRGGAAARQRILTELGSDGPAVMALVEQVTETDHDPKPPWRPRKVEYIEHVDTLTPGGLRIAVADKLHNARTQLRDLQLDPHLWDSFSAGADDQRWWYESLVAAFRSRARELDMGAQIEIYIDELEHIVLALFA